MTDSSLTFKLAHHLTRRDRLDNPAPSGEKARMPSTFQPAKAPALQVCVAPDCTKTYDIAEPLLSCPACGNLLDVAYEWNRCPLPKSLAEFSRRACSTPRGPGGVADFSGVWRFRELLPFAGMPDVLSIGEGRTIA